MLLPQLPWRRLSAEDNGDRRVTCGGFEGRSPNANYSEIAYLARNPEALSAVLSGEYATGIQHFLAVGWGLGLSAAPGFEKAVVYTCAPPDALIRIPAIRLARGDRLLFGTYFVDRRNNRVSFAAIAAIGTIYPFPLDLLLSWRLYPRKAA